MHSRFASLFALAVLAIAIAAATTGRAQVISTLSAGPASVGSIGSTYSWGQTFQTPDSAAATLDQLVVRLDAASGMSIQAFIATWTTSATGSGQYFAVTEPMLWSGTAIAGSDSLVTFNTGSLALNASTSYAFYIGITSGSTGVALNNSSSYSNGGAASWTRTSAASTPNGGYYYANYYDLQFEATFSAVSISPVPEPSTYATIGLALCGVLALVRRRRSRPSAPACAGTSVVL